MGSETRYQPLFNIEGVPGHPLRVTDEIWTLPAEANGRLDDKTKGALIDLIAANHPCGEHAEITVIDGFMMLSIDVRLTPRAMLQFGFRYHPYDGEVVSAGVGIYGSGLSLKDRNRMVAAGLVLGSVVHAVCCTHLKESILVFPTDRYDMDERQIAFVRHGVVQSLICHGYDHLELPVVVLPTPPEPAPRVPTVRDLIAEMCKGW